MQGSVRKYALPMAAVSTAVRNITQGSIVTSVRRVEVCNNVFIRKLLRV